MWPAIHWHGAGLHLVGSTYHLAIALGVALGLVIALRRAKRPDAVLIAAPLAVLGGMLLADAWHAGFHASPGLSSLGGIAGGLVVLVVASRCCRAAVADTLDAVAPAALAGFAVGRIGCFLAGCCYGEATDLPWGVVFPALGPPARHPAQLYAAVLDLAVARWAGVADGRAGAATARAFTGYGAVRILLEPLRDPAGSDLLGATRVPIAHVAGVSLALAGLAFHRRRRAVGPG